MVHGVRGCWWQGLPATDPRVRPRPPSGPGAPGPAVALEMHAKGDSHALWDGTHGRAGALGEVDAWGMDDEGVEGWRGGGVEGWLMEEWLLEGWRGGAMEGEGVVDVGVADGGWKGWLMEGCADGEWRGG